MKGLKVAFILLKRFAVCAGLLVVLSFSQAKPTAEAFAEQNAPRLVISTGHASATTSVAFSPDGRYVLYGSADGTLGVWEVNTGREISSFSAHMDDVTSVAFSPDGRFALSGSVDKTLKLWDLFSSLKLALAKPSAEAFANLGTDNEIQSFSGHMAEVLSVAFSPDGLHVLSGSSDKTVKLWKISTGREVRSFSGHTGSVTSVVFSPDGRYVLSGSRDTTLKLWDIATGQEVRSLYGHRWQVSSVAFSPDGRYVLSGSYGPMKLWEAANGRKVRSFSEQTGWVSSVSFSPDGRYALSGSRDKTLRLWDIATGQAVRSFYGHTEGITSVAFSPDGRYALSASDDNTQKLWEVQRSTEAFANLITRIHLDKADWIVVTPDGRFDGSTDGTQLVHYVKEDKMISLDALFDRFYTPDLVMQALSGAKIAPDAPDIGEGWGNSEALQPPLVRIMSPKTGETLQERIIMVMVEATDHGGGLEEIRLYHNSKWIGGTDLSMKNVGALQRAFTVSLLSGTNVFRATAFSRDRTESCPFEVAIKAEIPEATPNLHIVAVCMNNYKNRHYDLNHTLAKASAQAVVASLSEYGTDIFRDINVQTVFDKQATRPGIEAALKRVEQDARPEDAFVFYYAGTGFASTSKGDPQQSADFYLVPARAPRQQLHGSDRLSPQPAKSGISLLQLRDICRRIEARKQLVILDIHQPDDALTGFASATKSIAAAKKAIAQLARSAGLTALAFMPARSAGLKRSAMTKELGHGLLTYTLLRGMEGKADFFPKDGRVTVSESSNYIRKQIPKLSERYGGKPLYPNIYVHGQDFAIAAP